MSDGYRIHLVPQESRQGWTAYIYRPGSSTSDGATAEATKGACEQLAREWIEHDRAHPLPPDEWIDVP